MSQVSPPSQVQASAPALAPPQGQWIPRMIHEIEAPFTEPDPAGAQALQREEDGIVELMSLFAQPWAVAHAQWSLLNLALANLGSWQADWAEAWWRFFNDFASAMPWASPLGAEPPPAAPR